VLWVVVADKQQCDDQNRQNANDTGGFADFTQTKTASDTAIPIGENQGVVFGF